MTTYLNDYGNAIYSTNYSDLYNGVVKVSYNGYYGTGALLYDGKSILTTAHLFNESNLRTRVYIDTAFGTKLYYGTTTLYTNYDSINANGDFAIVTLDEHILSEYNRYELYRTNDEIGKVFTMVGYGKVGNGTSGEINLSTNIKLQVQNRFDTDFYTLSKYSNLTWNPLENAILAADFDNGTTTNDAIGILAQINDTGLGIYEGIIAQGDSGSPAFIDNKIAGVASYTASLSKYQNNIDINNIIDSSFGEVAAWQRVSYFQEFIDKTIRENYPNAPKTKDEVKTSIVETDGQIQYTYFLLEYLANRTEIEDFITVKYSTRSGTAIAGDDYIHIEGVLTLYLNESSALIAVEILGDNIYEEDEYFYLDVTSPSHGSFGYGIETLSAMRTIINDDLLI